MLSFNPSYLQYHTWAKTFEPNCSGIKIVCACLKDKQKSHMHIVTNCKKHYFRQDNLENPSIVKSRH